MSDVLLLGPTDANLLVGPLRHVYGHREPRLAPGEVELGEVSALRDWPDETGERPRLAPQHIILGPPPAPCLTAEGQAAGAALAAARIELLARGCSLAGAEALTRVDLAVADPPVGPQHKRRRPGGPRSRGRRPKRGRG